MLGGGVIQKWNPQTRIMTKFRYDPETKKLHVQHSQLKEDVDAILERNKAMQNSWKGRFGDDLITQTASVPIILHEQFKKQCGFQEGHGYDTDKYRKLLNDPDYRYLKTVTARL
jgi:hypothetical protein